MLVVVNECMLFGASGGRVHGQTAGNSGAGHVNINTIAVLAVTVRKSVLVDDVSMFFRRGVGGPWLFLVTSFVMLLVTSFVNLYVRYVYKCIKTYYYKS